MALIRACFGLGDQVCPLYLLALTGFPFLQSPPVSCQGAASLQAKQQHRKQEGWLAAQQTTIEGPKLSKDLCSNSGCKQVEGVDKAA